MALADIVKRIGDDAEAEVRGIVEAAEAEAETTLGAARLQAERATASTLERATDDALAEAATVRASARLVARDRLLAAKGELVQRALDGAAEAIVALPDAEYAALMASRIAAVARGGETVQIAATDRGRLAQHLPTAVEQVAGRVIELDYSDEPAQVERGVVLVGDRAVAELSVTGLINERRAELSMRAAEVLFEGHTKVED